MTAKKRREDSREARGYGWKYRKARAELLKWNPPCHWCGAPATTADHDPPLHVAGYHLNLVPACAPCNSRRGGQASRRKAAEKKYPGPSRDW